MTKRMLIAYAHPDDESFGIGSLIAKYSAEGVENTLICATDGDVGTVEPEKMKGYATIRDLRLAELNCAAEVLGFKEVITFGYRDSGMMNSADNADPRSLWQAPLEEVTTRIADVMRRVHPQVVITFDPFGAYGHPDHIKIHQATLAAFALLKTEPDPPQKLYYAAFPRALILRRRARAPPDGTRSAPHGVESRYGFSGGSGRGAAHPYPCECRGLLRGRAKGGGLPRQSGRRQNRELSRRRVDCSPVHVAQRIYAKFEPPPLPGQPPETDLFAGVVERSP